MSKTRASCIREVENWSSYENTHRLDHASFNPTRVQKNLEIWAPKMATLMKNIEQLDHDDMKRDGHLYKHLIFSDLKTNGGAKSIASALLSNGYSLIYDASLSLKSNLPQNKKNFVLLTSTKIYKKAIGVRFRRKVLDLFNSRPDNVYGQDVRFLILDSGFKEGIDVFDIRYIHILETPITDADQKQIIGRGTRFCGQKGLKFDSKQGWPLFVYKYRSTVPDSLKEIYEADTLYQLFLRNSNLNPALLNFGKELDEKIIQASVDLRLNAPIHAVQNDFKEIYDKALRNYPSPMAISPVEEEITIKYGVKMEKHGPVNCKNGCKGNVLAMPVPFMLIVWYMSKKATFINDKRPKSFLCQKIIQDPEYCKRLSSAWHRPDIYILKNEKRIYERLKDLPNRGPFKIQKEEMLRYVRIRLEAIQLPPEPPMREMSYEQLQDYISKRFKKFKWETPKIENLCVESAADPNKKTELIFTPTQDFVRHYFQPASIYKGLLLWQSVGTGKTCSAIATATTSFEKEGYTILWVTRHTLRSDLWKNVFQQICSIALRENMPADFSLSKALQNPLKYLSDRWMMPLTYKQFSNMLLKRNQFYKEMVKRNGEKDPLKKTILIIDEAHKLLSDDLLPQERPDFKILQKEIHNSYQVSGKDSVRVLLMSATPYTNDPMNFIKILNLLRKSNFFPETFAEFQKDFLTKEGVFKDPYLFVNQVSGYVSYLNREKDMRQFAVPIVKTIEVSMSESPLPEVKEKLDKVQEIYKQTQKDLEHYKEVKKRGKEKLRKEKVLLEERCKEIEDRKEKRECKEAIPQKIEQYKNFLFKEANKAIEENEEKMKQNKPLIVTIQKKFKELKENDLSQERILTEKCFKQKLA
uniref:Helicase ATP-binding domain-containing protein n=1 Tax=viral metagenome TaxID=1070528 RepID=A0A6C0CSB6_9ZZZZ